jgi:hypothetical protein
VCRGEHCIESCSGRFHLTVGVWRSLRLTVFGTYHGASTSMLKVFDWKRSRISMLELYSVSPDWFDYCFIYDKFLLVESFDFRPSKQYILVKVG